LRRTDEREEQARVRVYEKNATALLKPLDQKPITSSQQDRSWIRRALQSPAIG